MTKATKKALCKIKGCGDDVVTQGLCDMHRGRARRKSTLLNMPGPVHKGDRDSTLVVHCDGELKKKIHAGAKAAGISVSMYGERLFRKGLSKS